MKKVLSRLKNKKVALAVLAGILMILVNVNIIDVAMSEQAMEIANTILGLGVAVGIFSNPDSHEQK